MIFSILIIAVFGTVAFFHFTQGFFSAFISAVLTIVAASVAIGCTESVTHALLAGKAAEVANSLVMCMLFAGTYTILRVLFDLFIPGNVNFGSIPDKIGAAVMGIIAGVFAAGTVAVMAQYLPFGATMGMYSRHETEDKNEDYSGIPDWARRGRSDITADLISYDRLVELQPTPDKAASLWLPVDSIVLSFVDMFSAGSLAGDATFSSVHPNLLDELYFSRAGIQQGAQKTAFAVGGKSQASVSSMVLLAEKTSLPMTAGDVKEVFGSDPVPPTLAAKGGERILRLRVDLAPAAAEKDSYVRFSMGSFRLLVNGKDYYPLGYLAAPDGVTRVYRCRMDDMLVATGGAPLELIFVVSDAAIDPATKAVKGGELKLASGTALYYKRFNGIDLGGMASAKEEQPVPAQGVLQRKGLVKYPQKDG